MRWWGWLLPVVVFAAPPSAVDSRSPVLHVESRPLADGTELLTVFGRWPAAEESSDTDVPLLSVLRDRLGDADSANDRLRYVWVHTSPQPTLLQRAAASLPFFYWRPNLPKNADRPPVPVIDLGHTVRSAWTTMAAFLTQTLAIDPEDTLLRSSARSYRTNAMDFHRHQLVEGLAVLSQIDRHPEALAPLSEPEVLEIEARLWLAQRPLGNFVSAASLHQAYIRQRTRTEEMRSHNWELLRQKAEANGLYFDPLGPSESATHALLWVAREDLAALPRHSFDPHFLRIADPYADARLRSWAGYTVIRYFDATGRRVDPDTAGARAVELIPLALYSLDYPKVPLLLADFRSAHAPKRREMLGRAANDAISSVLGLSKFGNWPYFTADWAWNFVRTRHGATSNRIARLNAYSEVRQWLALDPTLEPGLRLELQQRLQILAGNPLEVSMFEAADAARRQYAALLRYAARLPQDRGEKTPDVAAGN